MDQNQQWSIIMLMIVVIVVLIAILLVYRFQMEKSFITDEPEEKLEDKNNKKDYDKRSIVIIMFFIFTVIVFSIYYIFKEDVSNGQTNKDSLVAFIPVWLAIFVPYLMRKNTKIFNINSEQTRILLIVLALSILIGVFAAYWFIQNFL